MVTNEENVYFYWYQQVDLSDPNDPDACNEDIFINWKPQYVQQRSADCSDYTLPKTPYESLPATDPKEYEPLAGDETGASLDNVTWYVPYKFYRISRLRIWPGDKGI